MTSPSWIDHFLAEPSSALFVRVPSAFLAIFLSNQDLTEQFPLIDSARQLLLSNISGSADTEATAREIYARAHAAFLMTPDGADAMFELSQKTPRLRCPRLFCKGNVCFPAVGPGDAGVAMFCPTCQQFYAFEGADQCPSAAFSSPYVEGLVERHPESVAKEQPPEYVPRIYGFRLFREDGETENE